MDGFRKALESLQPTDLAFLAPKPEEPKSGTGKRSRIQYAVRRNDDGTTEVSESVTIVDEAVPEKTAIEVSAPESPPAVAEGPEAGVAEVSPSSTSPPTGDREAVSASDESRKRKYVDHKWPPVGTILAGNYFGVVYRAEVVKADKRLKSGKQLLLMNGPAKGSRHDSFTRALLMATARQREESKLGRSGATNGWEFWVAEKASPSTVADVA